MMVVRLVEAEYSDGVLRPSRHLGLRPGERVNLIVVRRPDPRWWNVEKLASTPQDDDRALADEGLDGWTAALDAEERS